MASRDLIVHIVGDDSSLQRAYKQSTAATVQFDRKMSQTFRGAAAGSGVFKSLGRSLAFASGGFLAAASITDVLRDSITEATEAATVQRQLAAQFRASRQDLAVYQDQIDQATTKLSLMAGIQDEDLMRSFITAFRGTQNVSTGLKIQAIAADVARGRNIELSAATIALTKAFNGQTTALRRLGVNVPATLHGLEALNYVQAKFAGQAKAAATPQERFAVALKETEEIIGTALLPMFNDLLTNLTDWLSKTENQERVQKTASDSAKVLGAVMKGVGFAAYYATSQWNPFVDVVLAVKEGIKLFAKETENATNKWQTLTNQIERSQEAMGRFTPAGRPFVPGTTGGGAGGRASLAFQASMLQEQLAIAETRAGTKEDRAVLVRMQNLIRRRIAVTRDLKLRTQLYQDLGSVNKQIEALDDKIAADKQDAADKEKRAREKERDAERKRLEAHRDHVRRMRQLWQEQLQKIREATAQVRTEMGGLPFQPTPGGILGVTGQSAKGFANAYAAQTRAFVSFYNSLGALSRAGAPRGLVEQFRALGVEGGGLVRNLLTHPGQLRSVIRSYQQAERAAMQIAKADIHARYVTINMAGSRAGATSSTQRRGQRAGIPSFPGPVVG